MGENLSTAQLGRLDRVKPAFLKKVMGLHASCHNRHVYLLAATPLFVEDLQRQFDLPKTPAYTDFIQQWEDRMAEIDPAFFSTGAMNDETWKGPHRTNRHVIVRYAVHGFHHVLCANQSYHEPNENCVCVRCEGQCGRYHAGTCPRTDSLNSLTQQRIAQS